MLRRVSSDWLALRFFWGGRILVISYTLGFTPTAIKRLVIVQRSMGRGLLEDPISAKQLQVIKVPDTDVLQYAFRSKGPEPELVVRNQTAESVVNDVGEGLP